MHINRTRLIFLAVIVIMLLLSVALPQLAGAVSMGMTSDNHDSTSCQEENDVPVCCAIADCSPYQCILTSTDKNDALMPDRSNSKDILTMVSCQTNMVTNNNCLNSKYPFERDPNHEFPLFLYNEYHCRNSLETEELSQI
jgi:hypothetical protein